MEEGVKTSTSKSTGQSVVTPQSTLFVKTNEFDSGEIVHKLGFSLSDDPGNPVFGSCALECPDDWNHVADVPDGREA